MNIYYGFALTGVIIASFSQILLKIGANRPHVSLIKDYLNVPVILGYSMMMISVVAGMLAYRGINFMSAPVIEALGFVLVPVLCYFFFGEKITKNKLIGIVFIMAGIATYYLL